jgi:hypothetical protein
MRFGDITVSDLAGLFGRIVTTDENGQLQIGTATITDGVAGGSLINVTEHASDPSSGNLIAGDIWITDNIATGGKLLKYWDGTDKYSVELSKE